MSDPRFPIGPSPTRHTLNPDERRAMIDVIAAAPARLREAVGGLDDAQLDTPYREGGWTVRQVAHHVPDSHLNAYVRLKMALTENEPAVKPYDEAQWAKLPDTRATPIETSLTLLDSLHARWVTLFRSMRDDEFRRTFRHPDHGVVTLDWMVATYSWHSLHHVAHVTSLRERMGW